MKAKVLAALSILCAAVSAGAVNAATGPRAHLSELVAEIQKSPTDTSLREKAIKLAATLKPAPATPEEAERRLARGEAAFERAKEPADFAKAVDEFQAAANAAPWLASAYFNLGTAQEKANRPKDAMASFHLYVLAAPDAKDAADIKKRIYKLEFAAEEAATEAAKPDFSGRWGYDNGNTYEFLPQPDGSINVRSSNSARPAFIWGHARINGRTVEGNFEAVDFPDGGAAGSGPFKGVLSDDNKSLNWSGEFSIFGKSFGPRQMVLTRQQ